MKLFNMIKPKILMIFIEPAPYILGLLQALIPICLGQIDVLFLEKNKTQEWNSTLSKEWLIFPKSFTQKIRLIKNIFIRNQYDLIHIAGWGEPIFLLIILLAKFKGVPVSIETDTPLHYTKFWKSVIKKIFYPPLFSLIRLFLPGGIRQTKYLQYYGVSSERIYPVQMTVDTSYIKKVAATLTKNDRQRICERYAIQNDHTVFLYVGRLELYKGITDLISAFSLVSQSKTTLLIAGDGSLRKNIEEVVKQDNRIRYVGRQLDTSLIEHYYAADVLVLPSRSESWGLVINEAMAVGRPVIVSDRVGCIDDLVTHRETGLIYNAENIAELKNSLEYMIDVTDECKIMGKNAAIKIADWTLENEAKKICQAWDKLVFIEQKVLL